MTVIRNAKMAASEFESMARAAVPYVGMLGFRVERFAFGEVTVRLPYQEITLRPGGTVCGPAMMGLADITLWGVVLSMIGKVELAVTTDLGFHFLRKPAPLDLVAHGRILKLGTRLAVGEVQICPDGSTDPVAHCTGTYAIPGTHF